MARNLTSMPATIPSSGTTSDTLTMQNNRVPLAIVTPATMTGTSLTFRASWDGATFLPVFLEGTQYSVTISASQARHVALDRRAMDGVRLFQIVSGSTEGASRALSVIAGE
jgi:hypothetical protein